MIAPSSHQNTSGVAAWTTPTPMPERIAARLEAGAGRADARTGIGVESPWTLRRSSRGDLVQRLGDLVGGREHCPVAGRQLVQLPVGVGEERGARVALFQQRSDRGDGDAALGAEDRGAPYAWRPRA